MESVERGVERVPLPKRFSDLSHQAGLGGMWLLLSFAVALLAVFCRCPSLFTHAEFYAEDGAVWYAQAYNYGWLHSLALPSFGYLQTLQRLLAGIALLVPFRWAPFTMMVTGLFWQALPVPVMLSKRCKEWGPLPLRIAFAAAYIAIPNAREIHVVCTNSQWHLGVVLGLLAFASPPKGLWSKLFDVLVFSIAGVSGPFGMFLLPLMAIFYYLRRQRWTAAMFSILAAGSIIQVVMILRHYAERHQAPLGAKMTLLIRLLGGNGFIGALLGSHLFGLKLPLAASGGMLLLGLALCLYCAMCLKAEVRLFFIFCFMIYAAGMRSPMIGFTDEPSWPRLLQIPSQRYLFFPSLALLFSILWCAAFARQRLIRMTAVALTLILCVGICRDWRIPPMQIVDASKQITAFEEAKSGERVVIPIYPPGWDMTLIKR